jgi:putative polyhydroxyalkanoate system protein
MATIHIQRAHQLGLAQARKVAWRWAEEAERDLDMACTVEEGDDGDTVHFTRSGVSGTLDVTGDRFELQAKLGMLVGAFAKTIQAQIEKQLDEMLAAPAKKAARKSSGKG